jgi:hypothetical protein
LEETDNDIPTWSRQGFRRQQATGASSGDSNTEDSEPQILETEGFELRLGVKHQGKRKDSGARPSIAKPPHIPPDPS